MNTINNMKQFVVYVCICIIYFLFITQIEKDERERDDLD